MSEKIRYVTPLENFDAVFDHLHRHTYPEKHNQNEFEATLGQVDLNTNKQNKTGSYELNINPNFKQGGY